jgi:hypothetical protein
MDITLAIISYLLEDISAAYFEIAVIYMRIMARAGLSEFM